MKRILCLTDFSENSLNSILYANELAKKFSAKLIFMHAYETISGKPEFESLHPSLTNYSDTEARDKLYKICMDFIKENKYNNVTHEFFVSKGEVNQNLNTIVLEKKIDLVVSSIEGALKPGDAHYGNIVSEIAQNTTCPVLMIPSTYKFRDIKNIVYAFDIENEDSLKKEAIDWAKLFDARIDILSYSNEEDELKMEGLYSKYNLLKEDINYHKTSFDIKATDDNMIDSMNQFIANRNMDLIILENHKRTLYEQQTQNSFTKKFIFFSKVPVLILRNKENE
ncbi:MAG TPA: universal stress protein [Cytophagaceae bacterium]|jgi:nucleotide-binding universal stress UspA family protein|nr:universal stress protein [Cytophagaceae bacterium]